KASSAEISDKQVVDKLSQLHEAYTKLPTDSLPAPPEHWQGPDGQPSTAALATPFGALWQQVRDCVDENSNGSVVHEMKSIGVMLGFPKLGGIDEPPQIHTRRRWR